MTEADKNLKELRSYRTVRSIKSLNLKKNTKINRTHIVMDVYNCEDKSLAKANLLEQKVKKIMQEYQLEPKIQTFYQFKPFGVTAIICAQGLQITMHTWPEYKSAAIDLYSFNGRKIATELCQQLQSVFKSGEYEMRVRKR